MRRWLWGALAIAVYTAAAVTVAGTGLVIPRPLYDGLAPAAPYRFVSPPPDLAEDNEEPQSGEGVVDLIGKGSEATSISTGDGQLQVVLQKGAFRAHEKEKTVEVRLEPLAPPEPLEVAGGLRIEGNAYSITAEYGRSGEGAEVRQDVTIVLRYPQHATALVRRDGSRWLRLDGQRSESSLQLFAASDRLGVFAAAGVPPSTWTRWIPYGAGALGLIAGVLGYLSGRRGWLRRGSSAGGKKGDARKRKPPPRAKRKPGRQV
jgi:hypothetical protein